MITTISLNPSIDRTVEVERFVPGGLNRVVEAHSVAAGKGVNVALAASALGVDAECIGFMYKEGARLFEKRLMLNATAYNFIWCEGSVRTNIKVFDREKGEITEINEPGARVGEADLERMTELVALHAENTDCLVLSGSMPPGCPKDYYRTLLRAVDGLGCRCILDAEGERLALGVEAKPYLIKPNRFELETMVGRELRSLADIRDAAAEVHRPRRVGRGGVAGRGRRADRRRRRGALRAAHRGRGEVHGRRGRHDGRRARLRRHRRLQARGDVPHGRRGGDGALRDGQLPRGRPRAVQALLDRVAIERSEPCARWRRASCTRRAERAARRAYAVSGGRRAGESRAGGGWAMRSEPMGCLLIGEAERMDALRAAWRARGVRGARGRAGRRGLAGSGAGGSCTNVRSRAARASPRRARGGRRRWRWPRS